MFAGSTFMKAPAQMETARLLLLQPQAADAVSIFERYASDSEVTKFLGWPRHESVLTRKPSCGSAQGKRESLSGLLNAFKRLHCQRG
jgi:RimJ/RimL family protein N-acetyltransferase